MPAQRDPKELDHLAVPETTRRTYRSGINHYRRWGGTLPTTVESLRQYLAEHSKELKPTTLETRLAAIGRFHREGGWPDPTKDPAVQRVMKGIRAESRHNPRQAEPLLWHELKIVIEYLESQIAVYPTSLEVDIKTLRAVRDRALLLIGWWGAMRASDIASLVYRDLDRQDYGWEVTLFGKGDRQNQGEHLVLQTGYRPCPHQALDDWTQLNSNAEAPLFPGIRHGSGEVLSKPLDVRSITRVIQRRTAEAGLIRRYSSHSLRRGWGVSWGGSLTLGEFMQRGRWKSSDVAVRYQMRSKEYYRDQGWLPASGPERLKNDGPSRTFGPFT